MFTVYGGQGSGSVPVEATLTLLGLQYDVVETRPWEGEAAKEIAGLTNPLRQVPSLVLPTGEVMTESAAILLWLADAYAPGDLAPAIDDPRRAEFLRWMLFVPAQIYPMYLMKDDPSIWLHDEAAQDELRERAVERIKTCWHVLEQALRPGPYAFGEQLTVLDVYLTVVSRWTPRRRWHEDTGSCLVPLFERVDADPRLQDFWPARFPFSDGWKG